jgi:hypothetical protein
VTLQIFQLVTGHCVTTAKVDTSGAVPGTGPYFYASVANELPKAKCKNNIKYFVGGEATADAAVAFRNDVTAQMLAKYQEAVAAGGIGAGCAPLVTNFTTLIAGETGPNVWALAAGGCYALTTTDPAVRDVIFCRTEADKTLYETVLATLLDKRYTVLSDAKSDIAFKSHFDLMVADIPFEAGFSTEARLKARILDAAWATQALATIPGKSWFAAVANSATVCANWMAQNHSALQKELARSIGISEDDGIDASLVGDVKAAVVYDFYSVGGELIGPGALCCRDGLGYAVCGGAGADQDVNGRVTEVQCGGSASLPALW